MLYKRSTKPLYEQLKDQIRSEISNKTRLPGDTLEGERKLSQIYKISRPTVRRALKELINEGFLKSVHGKGTYVQQKKIQHRLGNLVGVAEELMLSNDNIEIEVVSENDNVQDAEIATLLKINENQKIFNFVRLIRIGGEEIVINYTYMPNSLSYIYSVIDFEKDIVYYALEKFGYKIYNAEQSIIASKPEVDEAKFLNIKISDPVLVLKRTTYLEDGAPIIYEKSVYRADKYEYFINLQRNYRGNGIHS